MIKGRVAYSMAVCVEFSVRSIRKTDYFFEYVYILTWKKNRVEFVRLRQGRLVDTIAPTYSAFGLTENDVDLIFFSCLNTYTIIYK